MVPSEVKALSKRLSYILRHDPGDLEMEEGGWVEVEALLATLGIGRPSLDQAVEENSKQRFEYSEDGGRIRARQGHSLEVSLGYAPQVPPPFLFHGTVAEALAGIRAAGLQKMGRHAVHLSAELDTPQQVGGRRGRPLVLRVRAGEMGEKGWIFNCTGNGVWLVEEVPPEFIDFP